MINILSIFPKGSVPPGHLSEENACIKRIFTWALPHSRACARGPRTLVYAYWSVYLEGAGLKEVCFEGASVNKLLSEGFRRRLKLLLDIVRSINRPSIKDLINRPFLFW